MMSSLPMETKRDHVGPNKKVYSAFNNAVFVDKAALKMLMDDCIKKKAELAKCEMEKEIYKEKAREANEKLRSATEQLERLAKIFKDARCSIITDKTTPLCPYKDLLLQQETSNRCTMAGDFKSHDRTLQTLAQAQKERNRTQVQKIDMIESEIFRLKDEINRVSRNMVEAKEVIDKTASPISDNIKVGNVESIELRSEIKELSNQLKLAKEDVEKRKKDIELVKCLLSKIRNNSVNFANMVTLD